MLNLSQLRMVANELLDDADMLNELVTNRVDAKMRTPMMKR